MKLSTSRAQHKTNFSKTLPVIVFAELIKHYDRYTSITSIDAAGHRWTLTLSQAQATVYTSQTPTMPMSQLGTPNPFSSSSSGGASLTGHSHLHELTPLGTVLRTLPRRAEAEIVLLRPNSILEIIIKATGFVFLKKIPKTVYYVTGLGAQRQIYWRQ